MFGHYEVPVSIAEEGVSLSVEKVGENLIYRRKCGEEKVEKSLLASEGRLIINPIEPVRKPRELTPYLLIEFEKALVAAPKATQHIFLTFPIEIGVYISGEEKEEVLDVLTLMKQKFTLYGDPRTGVICKYWRSPVYSSLPSGNPLQEGIIDLAITNTTSSWIEVTKTILNAYGMKIFYGNQKVAMIAKMKITSKTTAEMDFEDLPLEEGMQRSLEAYTLKRLTAITTKFVMEFGL